MSSTGGPAGSPSARSWPRWVLAAIAVIEGVVLIGYGVADAVVAMTAGVDGPREVASPVGVAMQVIVLVGLGAALLLVANGWRVGRRWVRSPFVLAQLILGFILVSLASSGETATRVIGIAGAGLAAIGFVLALAPVSRRDADGTSPGRQ